MMMSFYWCERKMRLANRDHHISTKASVAPCQSSTLNRALEGWLSVLDQHLKATYRVSILNYGLWLRPEKALGTEFDFKKGVGESEVGALTRLGSMFQPRERA